MYTRAEYLSIATVIGTVVGAGIFGLPYIAAQAGFLTVAVYIVVLGAMVAAMHLMYGEIVLRTKDHHFLPGYAARYLGPWGKRLALAFIVPGLLGTLLAYGIIGGHFIVILLAGILPDNAFLYGFLFSIACLFLVMGRIKLLAELELGVVALLLLTVVGLTLGAMPFFDLTNITSGPITTLPWLFLPYGVVLYAVSGFESIPEVREIFEATPDGRRSSYVKAILTGTLIPAFIYIIFTAAVLGVTGARTTEDALQGLAQSPVIDGVVRLAALFGLLAIIGGYMVMADNLKKILWYDLGLPKVLSWLAVFGITLIIYLFNHENFVTIIGVVGAIAGGLGGVMTVLIHHRARRQGNRQPEYRVPLSTALGAVMILLFVLGAGYQLWTLFSG